MKVEFLNSVQARGLSLLSTIAERQNGIDDFRRADWFRDAARVRRRAFAGAATTVEIQR